MIRIVFKSENYKKENEYMTKYIGDFFKSLQTKDHDLFKQIPTEVIINNFNVDDVIAMINRNTDWLTNKKYLKDYLILYPNKWIEFMDPKITSNLSYIIDILKSHEGKEKLRLRVGWGMQFDFDLIVNNHKWLEVVLSKLKYISDIFKNIDVRKIPQSFFDNPKYTNIILVLIDSMHYKDKDYEEIINKIPTKCLTNKDIWDKHWKVLYNTHKDKYLQLVPTKWWTYEQLYSFVSPEIMQKYYDFLLKESKFASKLIENGKTWIVDYVKNEDFPLIKGAIKKLKVVQ